jgi:hypothetical protein
MTHMHRHTYSLYSVAGHTCFTIWQACECKEVLRSSCGQTYCALPPWYLNVVTIKECLHIRLISWHVCWIRAGSPQPQSSPENIPHHKIQYFSQNIMSERLVILNKVNVQTPLDFYILGMLKDEVHARPDRTKWSTGLKMHAIKLNKRWMNYKLLLAPHLPDMRNAYT